MDSRHAARALALQELFSRLVTKTEPINESDLLEELEVIEFDQELKTKIVDGVIARYAEIDPIITELAPSWPLAQIAPVDLTILRMGIWEGFISGLTPVKVVLNECIELAKQFGGINSKNFINGVLGALVTKPELQARLNPTTQAQQI